MLNQTAQLFAFPPTYTPSFIQPLLNAYQGVSQTQLNLDIYPEPYYGDFNQCSVVLLTHNPGNSTCAFKGRGSQFEKNLLAGNNPAAAYYNMAIVPDFPNSATNRFYKRISDQLHAHFEGIQNFKFKPFVRDLIPYHSSLFGNIHMPACANYLYTYFFNQVIETSFRSELHRRINAKATQPATVIYARGAAWTNPKSGLESIGWDKIGEVLWNGYIYKANFEKIKKTDNFNIDLYPAGILDHNTYIVVFTQPMLGAKFGLYMHNRAPLQPLPLRTLVELYENGATNITRSRDMDLFINIIK